MNICNEIVYKTIQIFIDSMLVNQYTIHWMDMNAILSEWIGFRKFNILNLKVIWIECWENNKNIWIEMVSHGIRFYHSSIKMCNEAILSIGWLKRKIRMKCEEMAWNFQTNKFQNCFVCSVSRAFCSYFNSTCGKFQIIVIYCHFIDSLCQQHSKLLIHIYEVKSARTQ